MRVPISFFMEVGVGSQKSVVSKRINYPFILKKVRVYFPEGCELKVEVQVIVSDDKSLPADIPPPGINIFQMLGEENMIRGNGNVIETECDLRFGERGKYIKFYCDNTDAIEEHSCYAVCDIQTLKGR